jgi:AraC family transcriptional regulator
MNARIPLLSSPVGLVEDVLCAGSRRASNIEDFSPDFQVAFPYRGVFIWHVGQDAVVGDPNQILFVTGGEAYHATDPRPGGYAELIITPDITVLSELTEAAGFAPDEHPLFRARSCRVSPGLQRMCARLLHRASGENGLDPIAIEEEALAILRAALEIGPVRLPSSARTRRLIARTREFLQAEFANRLALGDVAAAVGASAAYLTDVFTRYEGVSLMRYVTQLRLARALIELPEADDLTQLALDLGFSSHSHFTFAFRCAFDCTPSQFRDAVRQRVFARPPRPLPLPCTPAGREGDYA